MKKDRSLRFVLWMSLSYPLIMIGGWQFDSLLGLLLPFGYMAMAIGIVELNR